MAEKSLKVEEEAQSGLTKFVQKSSGGIEAKEILRAASLLQEFNIILSKLELVKPQF